MTDVDRVRELEKDHKPDGFPEVEMDLLTRLADGITELSNRVKEREKESAEWRAREVELEGDKRRLLVLLKESESERDALQAKLARAKEFARQIEEGPSGFNEEDWKREVEEVRA